MCVRMIFVGAVLVASSVLTGCAGITTNAIREDRMQIQQAALAQAQGHPIVIDRVVVGLNPEFENEPRSYAPEVYRRMLSDNVQQAAANAGLTLGQGPAYRASVLMYRIFLQDGKIDGLGSMVRLTDPAGRLVASVPLENVANGTKETGTITERFNHRFLIPGHAAAIVALLQTVQQTGTRPEHIHPGVDFQKSYYGLEYPMLDATTERYAASVH